MTAWATDLEFAYDHGHLYVVDAERHWSEAEVDVRMPRSANFFVPLRVEGWGGRPPLDLDGWDHVTEFSLTVASGKLALASAGIDEVTVGIAPGAYRARWSGRNLQRGGDLGRRRREPAGHLPAADLARPDRGAARRDQALAGRRRAPSSATCPRCWPTRTSTRSARSSAASAPATRCGSTSASPGANGRTWDRTIRADGVVRWVVSSSRFHRATLHAEHPGLLPYTDDFGGLSFHGRAADPERLAHALRAAHAELAGRHIAFEEVVNSFLGVEALLDLGYGQLANGPVTLLRRYAEVAEAHGVATRLTITGPGRTGLCLLELGETSVVAERFTVA